MSEPVKITSVEKAKDPRRVEAGKKLGAISRQAKEKKASETSEARQASNPKDESCVELSSLAAVFVAAAVIGGIVLHYKTSSKSQDRDEDKSRDPSPSKSQDPKDKSRDPAPAPKRELDTLG